MNKNKKRIKKSSQTSELKSYGCSSKPQSKTEWINQPKCKRNI